MMPQATAVTVVAALTLCAWGPAPVSAPEIPTTTTRDTTVSRNTRRQLELLNREPQPEPFTPAWLAFLPKPPNTYWDKVAQCETASNWKDRGNFAGGLGIAYATWVGFGGEQFGRRQWQATRLEQIEVANRIALHGWMNSRGQFTEPVGFNGWGCIRNNTYLKPPVNNPWQHAKEQS